MTICPAPRWSRKGNRITADRWSSLLRELGHKVTIRQSFEGESCDLMVALHARRSAAAIHNFARLHPDRPLVVVLTGTDLYRDIQFSRRAQQSLELATRLVVLQPRGRDELAIHQRPKTRSIIQSAKPSVERTRRRLLRRDGKFQICVIGHLRHEKDPFRIARATRLLDASSQIRVVHAGAALVPAMGRRAEVESRRNLRYRWLGELSYGKARRLLASSDLMVLTSRLEGGANVISEALADQVPIIASRIPSTEGLLESDYPGLFPVGDHEQLAVMIRRAETEPRFYQRLQDRCVRLAARVTPERERESWRSLIAELFSDSIGMGKR